MRWAACFIFLATLPLLGQVPSAKSLPLAELVTLAAADMSRLPPAIQPHVRYLTLQERQQYTLQDAARTLSGHCNGLSRETDIVVPTLVGPGLLRVNLEDYGWKVGIWEQLAEADPWYHVKTVTDTVWPGGVYPGDGKHYAAGAFSEREKTTAIAPWLTETPAARAAIAALVAGTRSKAPILRADWFFNQTAAAIDRKPNYYDFLGIKDEKTFQALVGFDAKRKRRKVEIREAVADSGVALQPRGIIRETAEDGAYWKTYDFRKSVDKVNPLRVLNGDLDEAFLAAGANDAASEQYGHLANGMWATFLGNNKGVRQDTAPDFIASDSMSRSNDKRVHANVSCLRCHLNGGLQDIDGWARNLFQPPLSLQSPDYAIARRLRQQYARKLEPYLDRDRAMYAESVMLATGWDTKEYARQYAGYWESYEDAKVDAAYAAADLGITPAVFVQKLTAYMKATGNIDTVLSVFLLKGPRQRTIGIRQWEEGYPLAQYLIRGYQP